MDDRTTRLRSLGYHQDLEGRWVHGQLGFWLVDPEQLLGVETDQVDAFHDLALWAELRPAPRPLMDADLGRAANQLTLEWQGWLGIWTSPSGLELTQRELADLGPEGLESLEARRLVWLEEHGRRRFAGCAGMAVMILWLGVGWIIAGSVTVWLIGMGLIAVGSWLMRPVPWPEELAPDPPNTQAFLDEGRAMLGEAWEPVAVVTSPIPADTDHVHFLSLDRSIALDTLFEHFSPRGFLRILHALEPVDESDPETAPTVG